jgi:hypothetical protein
MGYETNDFYPSFFFLMGRINSYTYQKTKNKTLEHILFGLYFNTNKRIINKNTAK